VVIVMRSNATTGLTSRSKWQVTDACDSRFAVSCVMDLIDHLEHLYISESTRSARTRRHMSAVMTQVVSPHVGGIAANASGEGCQYVHPATASGRLVEQ
jgi:hypothetical protein